MTHEEAWAKVQRTIDEERGGPFVMPPFVKKDKDKEKEEENDGQEPPEEGPPTSDGPEVRVPGPPEETTPITREEILQHAMHRAEHALHLQDISEAFAIFISELRAHEETQNHAAIEVGFMMMLGGQITTTEKMRKFLQGFH